MKLTAIVLVGVFVSVVALMAGYHIGLATQVRANLIGKNASRVFPNQPRAESLNEALETYTSNCAGCHGTVGEGSSIAPPLNRPELETRLDNAEIKATIEYGRLGTAMPAWKNRLTDVQISSLVNLLLNWDQLDTEQLSQLEAQAPYQRGMENWRSNKHMMGDECGMGMMPCGWRSP
jgi:cytochrome c oxidase cbb3-type subunit 3